MRVLLQPAYILHHRAYRETSVILDLLTPDHGRIALVARGVRTNRSSLRPLLQPFQPLLTSFQGRTELMTLLTAEPAGAPLKLRGDCLFSGFYLNELLIRLLQKQDPHPQLYTIYHHTLLELQGPTLQEKTLRLFEKKLLEELGYGLQLQHDFLNGKALSAEGFYQFYPERGFKQVERQESSEGFVFSGHCLLALAKEQLEDEKSLREIKRLMRFALTSLLGLNSLHSRELFR